MGVQVGLPLSSGFSKNYGDWSSRREYVYTNTRNKDNPKATQVPWRCRSPPVSLQDSERGTSSRKIRFGKNITSCFVWPLYSKPMSICTASFTYFFRKFGFVVLRIMMNESHP